MAIITHILSRIIFYTLATLGLVRCIITGFVHGKAPLNHRQRDKLSLARQRFWALSDQPLPGFEHAFITLKNGRKLHYIHNQHSVYKPEPLIIFIHGFPDSCFMWRHFLAPDHGVPRDSHLVCLDLPGYGGSDSFDVYDVSVLNALCKFCIAMRQLYRPSKVILVAHDWGCTLATQLAGEAPALADHFVLINGLFAHLAISNFRSRIRALPRLLSRLQLCQAYRTVSLLSRQVWRFAYVCSFDLSGGVVGYILGEWKDMAVLRGLARLANCRNNDFNLVEALAASLGPDAAAASAKQDEKGVGGYGSTVLRKATSPATLFWNMTGLYRNGVLRGEWVHSEELKATLQAIKPGTKTRKSSFNRTHLQGQLQAPATIIWGLDDHVMERQICFDRLAEGGYLAPGSEVITLPRAGHWVPLESECLPVLTGVLQHLVRGEAGDCGPRLDGDVVKGWYRGAKVVSRT
ncbi:Alpha/Beta hydrolase protein [Aspergillus multicolor]|uniref:alpha/beta fold hydrolase n=1 Tax=Aspergillus multicolor TaxID=41759 RepID=UPI003CCD9528